VSVCPLLLVQLVYALNKTDFLGKTSLTKQYIQPPSYVDGYFPTIEQTERKRINYDGIDYDCEIIDTAGQVCYPPLAPSGFDATDA
jgi:GTPase SAR1 family protein